jgi:hypothetical protein
MRIFIAALFIMGLSYAAYYAGLDWTVVVGNTLIILFWALYHERYEYLPFLGMMGTVIGLALALLSVAGVPLNDAAMIGDALNNFLSGVGLSVTTTIVGGILWFVEDWSHEG